jgi:F-type H+-transporting ATPase subunit delta
MQIPKEARRKARDLFDATLDASGRPNVARSLEIVDLLVKAAPRHLVLILKEFSRLIRLETEKHHAVIETAAPIDEMTKNSILQSLQLRDGGEVTLEARVDPSLIGGARIRLGSEVWDASVKSRLQLINSASFLR